MANSAIHMVISGLGTTVASVQDTGTYDIIGSLSLPAINKGDTANSQVVTVVKQNATTLFTGSAGSAGFMLTGLAAAAGDTFSVILSSSTAVDQGLNVIKATVAIG